MLTWCLDDADSITEGEQKAMMESLRSATQNTMFEQWLDATMRPALQTKQTKAQQPQVHQLLGQTRVLPHVIATCV